MIENLWDYDRNLAGHNDEEYTQKDGFSSKPRGKEAGSTTAKNDCKEKH